MVINHEQTCCPIAGGEAPLSGAPVDSEPRLRPMIRILLRVGRMLGFRPWVYEVLLEVRSCVLRSRTLIKLRTIPLCDLGPQFGVDTTGHLVVCSRTRGRRTDIHRFQSTDCLRTRTDLEIYLAGWNAGAKWCDDNPHSYIPPKGADRSPCMVPLLRRD